MAEFLPVLRSVTSDVFLLHCHRTEDGGLQGALMIVEAGVSGAEVLLIDGRGVELYARMPSEALENGYRFKAYHVTTSWRPLE